MAKQAKSMPSCVAAVALLVMTAVAGAQHGAHPPMTNQKPVVQCRVNDAVIETPIVLASLGMASELNQIVELPAPLPPLRLTRYLPKATLEQSVVADESAGGHSAILLSIEGPTQSHQRWLVADEMERNRLMSFIGTWRYMAVADQALRDELLRQFETEFTRPPKLLIRDADAQQPWREVSAEPGSKHRLNDMGCRVRILEFFPHFGIDEKTNKPANQSGRRLNPAVLVKISWQGKKERRWVFSKFPDFGTSESQRLPFQLVLDCPTDTKRTTPDHVLVTTARTTLEVWSRHDGRLSVQPMPLNEKIKIAGSQYTFAIEQFVPSGRLVEEIRPDTRKGAIAAIEFETDTGSGELESFWLEVGKGRSVTTTAGVIHVTFAFINAQPVGGHP